MSTRNARLKQSTREHNLLLSDLSGEDRSHTEFDRQRHFVDVVFHAVQHLNLVETVRVIHLLHLDVLLEARDVLLNELVQLAQLAAHGNLDVIESQKANFRVGLPSEARIVILLHRLMSGGTGCNRCTLLDTTSVRVPT